MAPGRARPCAPAAALFASGAVVRLLPLARASAAAAGAVEGWPRLPPHLEALRQAPFGEHGPELPTLAAAGSHLDRGLLAAKQVGEHFGHRWAPEGAAAGGAAARRAAAAPGRLLRPADFGADPTGRQDSTGALLRAMAALLDSRAEARAPMADNITDLGGVTLDLEGGLYVTSRPLVFPAFVGNAGIQRGTLKASPTFPQDRWLVEIGDPGCKPVLPSGGRDPQASCNEFINLGDLLFDASHVAAGGVRVSNTMGATIGPSVFFIGFRNAGVRVDSGHEVMIQQAWFAEYFWSGGAPKDRSASRSIGVQLDGNDHILTNVIVFDFAHIGVEVNKSGNILQGVHTWNGGGTGIAVNAPLTRLLGCYLDYNKLVIKDPAFVTMESTFFLETHTVLQADKQSFINELRLWGNTYVATTKGVSIELNGTFTGGSVEIWGETGQGVVQLKSVSARRSLHQQNATKWTFDFSDVLLLPAIDQVVYSFVSDGDVDFVQHVARSPAGRAVTVETDKRASGTVTIDVSQAQGRPEGSRGLPLGRTYSARPAEHAPAPPPAGLRGDRPSARWASEEAVWLV